MVVMEQLAFIQMKNLKGEISGPILPFHLCLPKYVPTTDAAVSPTQRDEIPLRTLTPANATENSGISIPNFLHVLRR